MADLLETIEVPREIVKKDSPVIFRFFDDGIKALFEDDECKYTFAKFNAIRLKKAKLLSPVASIVLIRVEDEKETVYAKFDFAGAFSNKTIANDFLDLFEEKLGSVYPPLNISRFDHKRNNL